jgi:glycine cleavage system H protein
MISSQGRISQVPYRGASFKVRLFYLNTKTKGATKMNTPANLKYTKSDEWFDAATGKVGVTDFAQNQLSDIVFLEILVSVGDSVSAGDQIASVESVKAAAEVVSPVSGKVVAINEALVGGPEGINSDPFGAAWVIQVEGGDAAGLMDAKAYEADCAAKGH